MDAENETPDDEILEEILVRLANQNSELAQRVLGLQVTCAVLIKEICKLTGSPENSLIEITSSLSGLAHGVAMNRAAKDTQTGRSSSRGLTNSIDLVTQLAEHALSSFSIKGR